MFILAIVWVVFLILELVRGLSPTEELLVTIIWILFIVEFLLKLFLARHKLEYIKRNWLTVIALIIPAFRAFRLLRAIRLLKASRVVSTTKIVRALTSTNRFIKEVKEAQGAKPVPGMNVGVMVAHSAAIMAEELEAFAAQVSADVKEELTRATQINWVFHSTESTVLDSDKPHNPSDFLDSASLRMAEGPFDAVVVVTDVALMSRKKTVEAGLVSAVSRIIVLSTRKLIMAPRGNPVRKLLSPEVRWNGAKLLLHLLGHIAGLKHMEIGSRIMVPFHFVSGRTALPQFSAGERKILQKHAEKLPERELRGGNVLESFIFHILMAFNHPGNVIYPLLRNGALFLSLSLPGLATAAVAPSFLLVFSAEIWDVGLNMTNQTTVVFAVISVFAASLYLVAVQSLFLPRKEKRILTEHLAVANVVIFLSIFIACIGLFVLVGILMLVMEVYIFPAGLMKTWPTLLDIPVIHWSDKIRLATFISTIGVTTGALAGGFESRKVIQHLGLFHDQP